MKLKVPVRNINIGRKCDQERQFCDAHVEIESHSESDSHESSSSCSDESSSKEILELLSILPHASNTT